MEILLKVKILVAEVFKKHGLEQGRLPIVQRTNRFSLGDLFVPNGPFTKEKNEDFEKLLQNIKELFISKNIPITKVTSNDFSRVAMFLDRAHFYHSVIDCVMNQKDEYGMVKSGDRRTILLVNDSRKLYDEKNSLNTLRSVIVHETAGKLLTANGFEVKSQFSRSEIKVISCFQSEISFDIDTEICTSAKCGSDNAQLQELYEMIYRCRYVSELMSEEGSLEPAGDGMPRWLQFDLRQFITDNGLKAGSGHFDKNLHKCAILENGVPTSALQNAAKNFILIKTGGMKTAVHIVDQSEAFNQQKVVLLIQQLALLTTTKLTQCWQVIGPVIVKQGGKELGQSADKFIRLTYAQLRQAAIMKYGETVHGEGWSGNLKALTTACVKFHLLSCVPRNQLKLSFSDDMREDGTYVSTGSFVMYNCARLIMLFAHFQQAVDNGTFPPLPELEKIDFSTLREEVVLSSP
ncbi:DALR anticodon-binding domain-containing protein 3-like isoform X2 [Mya arenaria]|uniref:DALR anticodon-binding domain-containing protein 3-like isoform X2 n=1 Tax=Mya arenaria TaxID=6604 RepID=UPI0022E091E1|nr:DALR anticodon-binding domain-containing protein 3-like isoform X2 [Mya arenaria]